MPRSIPAGRRLVALGVALLALLALAPAASAGHPQPSGRTFGATTLTLDPGTAAALTSLGVTPGVVAPATAGAAGLSFPIVNPLRNALRTGQVRHGGGISLTAGATRVELRNFVINVDEQPDLTAQVGKARVSILDLDLSRAQLGFEGVGIRLGPVSATLTQAAADALNAAFRVTAFRKGLKLGEATVSYRLFG